MSDKQDAAPVVVTAADRPTNLLPVGDEPLVIANDADADKALAELGFMLGHRQSNDAETDRLLKAIAAKSKVDLSRDGKSYADREAELRTALATFTDAKHPELKSGNGPGSLKLEHGTLGYVKGRDKVEYAKGKAHKDAIAAIDAATSSIRKNKGGLLTRLTNLLGELVLFGRGSTAKVVSLFVRVEAKINVSDAQAAFKAKKITKAQLAKFHLVFKKGEKSFEAKPAVFKRPTAT